MMIFFYEDCCKWWTSFYSEMRMLRISEEGIYTMATKSIDTYPYFPMKLFVGFYTFYFRSIKFFSCIKIKLYEI